MRKIISFILATVIICMSAVSYAEFTDVPGNASYSYAAERMAELGIMTGDGLGAFRPDEIVTREQFAKIIVVITGFEGQVSAQKGIKIFNDVDPDGWSGGYINVAYYKKYIESTSVWTFNPQDPVTYDIICRALIMALGYSDQDVSGQRPYNYIDKAKDLEITEGFSLNPDDSVSRWMLAVMISRLLDTKTKGSNSTFAESKGLYTQCIVLANSKTLEKLSSRQILTDKGTYYINDGIEPEIGKKYGFRILNDTITAAYDIPTEVFSLTVESILGTRITYKAGIASLNIVLPDKTVYYYNGQKVANYDSLKGIVQPGSKIIFSYNSTKTGYEYAVIIDPIYSEPIIVENYDSSTKRIGDIDLVPSIPIIKNGEYIAPEGIYDGDVIYRVAEYDGNTKYILVTSNKIEGRISGFIPNKLSPQSIMIGNKTYEISKDMDISKITGSMDSFRINDYVVALMGYDNKIVDLVYPLGETDGNYAILLNTAKANDGKAAYTVKLYFADNTTALLGTANDYSQYKGSYVRYTLSDGGLVTLAPVETVTSVISKLFSNAAGLYTECIILGSAETLDKVAERQVATDKGIYYINNTDTKIELGSKYKVIIDGDTIVKIDGRVNDTEELTVKSAINNRINYTGSLGTGTMVLPDKTVYYYNGAKVSNYDSVKSLIQPNSSIVLAYNNDKSGYEYGVIYDPIYSSPIIVENYQPTSGKIGNIDMSDEPPIMKNGELISRNQIENGDLVYQVIDIWGGSKLIYVTNNMIEGEITAILPNSLAPKYIQIDKNNYEIGKHFNTGKLSRIDGFKVGDRIKAFLGYDDKVAELVYGTGEYISQYAYILNTSKSTSTNIEDFGKDIYYAKLLLDTGAVKTYKTTDDCSLLKGTLVRYVKADEEETTVAIHSLSNAGGFGDYSVNKEMRRFGDSFVSDNVKVFNFISSGTGDADVSLISWESLPEGEITPGKVLYIAKEGEFDDIVIICLDDIFNQRHRTAIVKRSDSTALRTQFTLLIDGKEYSYVSNEIISDAYIGTAFKVRFTNNTVSAILGKVLAEKQSVKIQAIDQSRIKIDNTVYKFKENISIYFIDYTGIIKPIGISDIDLEKNYGKVTVYLDKPGNIDGKVEAIVITE